MNLPISETSLSKIKHLAFIHDVKEIWLFGSSTYTGLDVRPNDIDIALLGIPEQRFDEVSESLKQYFPGSRVESGGGYTAPKDVANSVTETPFHFIIGTSDLYKFNYPIIKSIQAGKCLWRN